MTSRKTLPDTIGSGAGILVDEEIRRAVSLGYLIDTDTYEPVSVRQASYEVRLSERIKTLQFVDGQQGASSQAQYVEPAQKSELFEILPGMTVLVLIKEILDIPQNVVGHLFPLGNLYKVGLLPEVTYADPGFSGEFWIIISNYSTRVVPLKVGQPIARLQFTKLAGAALEAHKGAGAVRDPLLWPHRQSRTERALLEKRELRELIKAIEAHDSPHYDTGVTLDRIHIALERAADNARRIQQVEKETTRVLHTSYAVMAIALLWPVWKLATLVWPRLPSSVQAKAPEQLVGAIITALLIPMVLWLIRRIVGHKKDEGMR